MTEGLNLASAAKLAVSETAISNNALPTNQEQIGYTSPAATDNVASIAIGDKGDITITYTALAGGGTLILTPQLQTNGGEITWDCKGGTLAPKYRPANCRE